MITNRYLKEVLRTEKHELAQVWWTKEDAEQMYGEEEFTDIEWDEIADLFNFNIDHIGLSEVLYNCITEVLNESRKEMGNQST